MPPAIIDFYTPIKDFLGWLGDRAKTADAEVDSALRALQTAVVETKRYEEQSKKSGKADRDAEFNLATLWNTAAASARKANNDLAMRLGEKARYWSDETKWSPEEIQKSRISLVSIESEISTLLKR
jgi:hypothetical protein